MTYFQKTVKKYWPFLVLAAIVAIFFFPVLRGKVPVPADNIVGLYHPWRDVVWDNLTGGVPFKNFIVTDPVRQQYPWRLLTAEYFIKGQPAYWNPYQLMGTPHLANFQSAFFSPLNFLFSIFSFNFAWTLIILLQPLLAGFFLYLYLRHLKLSQTAALVGSLCFMFSGFCIAWLEWGTVIQTLLWLPLILLATDKIIFEKRHIWWLVIFLLAILCSFFAGHLQVFFYVFLFSFVNFLWQIMKAKENKKKSLLLIVGLLLLFTLISSVQWKPTLDFIGQSARSEDQSEWQKEGFFLPWQHLVQILVPDFFGNPSTLNYWGVFNYGEFVGFIGVIGILFTLFAFNSDRKKEVYFFFSAVAIALLFALPNPMSKLPFILKLPLISTSQPTRLLSLVDFGLAVLAAFGVDAFLRKERKYVFPINLMFTYLLLWLFVFITPFLFASAPWIENLEVTKRNLYLPTILGVVGGVSLMVGQRFKSLKRPVLMIVLLLLIFDLLRFGKKYTPFSPSDWVFPKTKTIEYLQQDKELFRVISTDPRLTPPNFLSAYQIQTISGYDPLYLLKTGELIAAIERNEPNIKPPFGFNRILAPVNYRSPIADLLNVKYVLSMSDLADEKLELVMQEGQTRTYLNINYFPRAFVVGDFVCAKNKNEAITFLFDKKTDLRKTVVLENCPANFSVTDLTKKTVNIISYEDNRVRVETETDNSAILVLTDTYYQGWMATIDGQATPIMRANYNFRAIIVPQGQHRVEFKYGQS